MIVVFFSRVFEKWWACDLAARAKPLTSLLFCVDAINEAETGNRFLRKKCPEFPGLGVDDNDSWGWIGVYGYRGEGGEILPSTLTPNTNQPLQHPTFTLYFDGKDDECDGATFAQVILIWITNVMVATSAPFYLKSEMILNYNVNPKWFKTTM